MPRLLPLTLVLLSSCMLPAAQHNRAEARGRDAAEREVDAELAVMDRDLSRRGYDRVGPRKLGTLEDEYDTMDDVDFTLEGGRTYAIIGACNAACSDMDLVLYDPADRRVYADEAADARPIVQVTPPRRGKYSVRVTIPRCARTRCMYGVALYRR